MKLTDYEQAVADTDVLASDDIVLPMLGLVGEVGSLVAQYKKIQRDRAGYRAFTDEVREELGDLFWYAAALARRCDLSLEEILSDNIRKARERFKLPLNPLPHPLFDDAAAKTEQLPRTLDITFTETLDHERGRAPVPVVRIHRGDSAVGDPLDDNSDDDDEYRYHDVFHLAHMAVLGWSPVMRSLLRVKRSTNRDTDRIQDGGRAIAVEEGLSAYVFSAARAHNYFRSSTMIPNDILKSCQAMTAHLEVSRRSAQDWQYAILIGYRMFDQLTKNRGGILRLDMNARTMTYRTPEQVRQANLPFL
ncbi:MazG nucleotide pyrophosphohydrolase domain-containing protein [Umezawaea sp. Da 62-37]|uniref:nucleoside triphosphate pyrophosphohydrolase family protein n=1 Tax=Umezawaea sp. Da 62-37 TaxID=3075927 RepID=UPI0028F7300B|nr:MazG nucleotide pyrophosphohydrolase domain-containing protein [Umezawaea sp. Da 62-37]WNV82890.1 MazG nucleotide pyrophosphohydrolase domain-containing protein [Umezawaea sp. Da 62-37]